MIQLVFQKEVPGIVNDYVAENGIHKITPNGERLNVTCNRDDHTTDRYYRIDN